MPSFKDADLAAIKARYKSNYALITNDPKIANDPVIIAALAKAKASEAAFYAALVFQSPTPISSVAFGNDGTWPVWSA